MQVAIEREKLAQSIPPNPPDFDHTLPFHQGRPMNRDLSVPALLRGFAQNSFITSLYVTKRSSAAIAAHPALRSHSRGAAPEGPASHRFEGGIWLSDRHPRRGKSPPG